VPSGKSVAVTAARPEMRAGGPATLTKVLGGGSTALMPLDAMRTHREMGVP